MGWTFRAHVRFPRKRRPRSDAASIGSVSGTVLDRRASHLSCRHSSQLRHRSRLRAKPILLPAMPPRPFAFRASHRRAGRRGRARSPRRSASLRIDGAPSNTKFSFRTRTTPGMTSRIKNDASRARSNTTRATSGRHRRNPLVGNRRRLALSATPSSTFDPGTSGTFLSYRSSKSTTTRRVIQLQRFSTFVGDIMVF